MASLYTFISAHDVQVFTPPNTTDTQHQVTATANQSGVTFVARFIDMDYKNASYVQATLDGIASGFNAFAAVPGVASISTYQDIDANNQLLDRSSVEVVSTSGKSSTVIDSVYPTAEFQNQVLQYFEAQVSATVAELDAIEATGPPASAPPPTTGPVTLPGGTTLGG